MVGLVAVAALSLTWLAVVTFGRQHGAHRVSGVNVLYRCTPALAAAALLVGCIDRGVAFLDGEDDAGAATTASSASTDASTTSTGTTAVCGHDTPGVVAAASAFLASFSNAGDAR